MTYSGNANPNATNSELDAKTIITHKELTPSQKYDLISQYCEIVVDGMDMKTLIQYVSDDLIHFYENKCDDVELKDYIIEMEHTFDNLDSGQELYDELVDNVTHEDDDEELTIKEQIDYINSNLTEGN